MAFVRLIKTSRVLLLVVLSVNPNDLLTDDKAQVYESFYKTMTCAGSLVWSLRPHSENGGFVTHGEGNNIYSYHAPGFKNQTSTKFDTHEADVISLTYDARCVSYPLPSKVGLN
jgi:hypothetical protein